MRTILLLAGSVAAMSAAFATLPASAATMTGDVHHRVVHHRMHHPATQMQSGGTHAAVMTHRSQHGMPRTSAFSRDTTQNPTGQSDESGSLAVPGSDAAFMNYDSHDKNAHYGY